MQIYPEPNFKIIGHRGAPAFAPENTLASFAAAAQFGLNWVEFDTLRLNTGEWIVLHDDTLDRTTNGKGLVFDKSLAYLKSLDAGSWFHPRYQNERIPLLGETLDFLCTLNLHPNIEIKTMPGEPRILMQSFLECLKAHWPSTRALPLISSFDLSLLFALQELQKNSSSPYPLGYIIREFTKEALEAALQYGFTTLNCHHRYIKASDLENIQAHGIVALLYVINDRERAEEAFRQGASAIFSNYPNLFANPPSPPLPKRGF